MILFGVPVVFVNTSSPPQEEAERESAQHTFQTVPSGVCASRDMRSAAVRVNAIPVDRVGDVIPFNPMSNATSSQLENTFRNCTAMVFVPGTRRGMKGCRSK